MGLRGARDAGIDVPDDVRKKCIDYVKQSQNSNGSFRYTMQGGHTTFAMTAAGVTSLYSAGIYEGEQVEKALEYLMKFKPNGAHRVVGIISIRIITPSKPCGTPVENTGMNGIR